MILLLWGFTDDNDDDDDGYDNDDDADDDDDDDVDDCNAIFFAAILSLSLITPLCISFLSLIC